MERVRALNRLHESLTLATVQPFAIVEEREMVATVKVIPFAVPRAGHWGFAALDIGPVKEHEGKPLSQDAVLWIHAWDME